MSAISTSDVAKAQHELDKMKRSLSSWLTYRQRNDKIASGAVPTKQPLAYAQSVIASARDTEQKLASQLRVLLAASFPDAAATLPSDNVGVDPDAAVKLAQLAIAGGPATPTATGGIFSASSPWVWPIVIVGGLLLAVTTAIRSYADVQMQKEKDACIQAGACTDYGFWLKAGGIAALLYVTYKSGILDDAKGFLKRKLA
jgi:hypothetical protein